jgi:glycosyltransferase involved in cell wall biosynthesis
MHICFLTHEYPKDGYPHGGVGTFVRTLSRNLVNEGIRVSVVGTNYFDADEDEEDNGVKIYRLAPRFVKGLTWYLNSTDINRKLKDLHFIMPIDIIESTELGLAFIDKKPNIKYLIRLHGGHHFFTEAEKRKINPWKEFQEKRSFAKADKIIGVSNFVIDHTAKYLKFEDKRGPAIYNLIDPNKFHEANPAKIVRGRILFAGTVCEKKGIRQLIEAMPVIKMQVPGAHLIVAGQAWRFPDGSFYSDWVKQFIAPEVKDNITFLGVVKNDDMPDLIESSQVCVYPSHMEAMPLSWIEVMAMGKTLVAGKPGPGPEIISDGLTGLLCDPYNPEDIAAKAIMAMKAPDLAIKIGKAARKDALERFSVQRIVQQNIEFYQSLLAE